MNDLLDTSPLPAQPDLERVNSFLYGMYQASWKQGLA